MKYILTSIIALFIFVGCAGKEFYEPEDTVGYYNNTTEFLNSDIVSMNRDGATLGSGEIITKRGVSKFTITEGYNFLNISEDKVITSNYKDKVMVENEVFEVNGVVVAATLQKNILALLFSDNSIQLLNMDTKKILLKEYFTHSFVNDTRIANPYFMDNIILFPTLDGKIVIVSRANNQVIKNIVVDADGQFNNIIFLDVVNETLIAATPNKIITVGSDTLNIKDYTLRDIIVHGESVFIATIDGQIIKLDIKLNEISKRKYKFAKFYALAYGTSLYALESQGYLINLSNDLSSEKIYDFSFDNEQKVIALGDTIYYDDEYIILQ